MRSPLFSLIILLALQSAVLYGYELTGHPRIYITPARLSELARRAGSGGMLAEDYAMMKKEADRIVAEETCRQLTSIWHRPTDMLCTCLVYLVERELGNDSALVYARAVKHIWEKESKYGPGTVFSNLGPGHFGYFAMCYDWIYDYLTPQERKTYGDNLGSWLTYYTNSPTIELLYGDWLYNKSWGPSHFNAQDCRDGIAPKLMTALALAGAGTVHEEACKSYLDSWSQRIPSDCIPMFDMSGGAWAESMGHGGYGPFEVIAWAFEAWRTATGQDWFQLGSQTTFLKEEMRWIIDLAVPFNNRMAYIDDDTDQGALFSKMKDVTPILGARYRDPVANWVSSTYDRGVWPRAWFTTPFQRFLSYDPAVAALTPGQAGWELAHLYKGAGHVHMRSRWDDPDATWAFFGAGPFYADHSRDDEGHFLIAKKGWLVMRAGGSGQNDDDYYAGGSLPFNLITVYDPNEEFRRTDGPADGGTDNEPDGGLIRRVYTHRTDTGGQFQARGQITAYINTLRYTYAAADLRDAYSKNKLKEITRQFLYLRGEKEYFVIFDRVEATNAAFPKTWFLHIPTRPSLDGTETVEVADHVLHYSGAKVSTWLSDPCRTDQEVFSSGRSRAFLSTLLPAGASLTARGGAGYEYWGNPHVKAACYNHTGKSTSAPPYVPWRLEVEPSAASARDLFLHVLEVTDEGQAAPSQVELLQNDGQKVVLRITPSGGEPVEVRFNSTGELGGAVRFGSGEEETLPVSPETSGQTGLRHDVNQDGEVGLADALALVLRLSTGSRDQSLDFNGDGRLSLSDALALLRFLRDAGAPGSGPYLSGNELSYR